MASLFVSRLGCWKLKIYRFGIGIKELISFFNSLYNKLIIYFEYSYENFNTYKCIKNTYKYMKNTLNYIRSALNCIKSTLKRIKYAQILIQNTHTMY